MLQLLSGPRPTFWIGLMRQNSEFVNAESLSDFAYDNQKEKLLEFKYDCKSWTGIKHVFCVALCSLDTRHAPIAPRHDMSPLASASRTDAARLIGQRH